MTARPLEKPLSGNVYVDSLLWGGWYWGDASAASGAPVTINYFVNQASSRPWSSAEAGRLAAALQTWSNVANITFTRVSSESSAQLVETLVDSATIGGDILGEHGTPDSAASLSGEYDGPLLLGIGDRGYGYYNYELWESGGLAAGGYDFSTLVHELGHGLGLAHPHDDGGGSGLFPGVSYGDDTDTGDFGLNQGIFTVMSYNDGWKTAQDPLGRGLVSYGYAAGPMAFDIAAIQHLYGANMSHNAGSSVYTLPSLNAAGTAWLSIWDAGGTDVIRYSGPRNAIINLTAATLDGSPTGGGAPSYAAGIFGGFTIANGVVIERAYGGSGNDRLTGNSANNVLLGNAGNDIIAGGQGDDLIGGGTGNDILNAGANGEAGDTVTYIHSNAGVRANLTLTTKQNTLGAGLDTLIGFENLSGSKLADTLVGSVGNNTLTGYAGNDTLLGHLGHDRLFGNEGADRLDGGAGNDLMFGGAHGDSFRFTSAYGGANLDTIGDFVHGVDKIALENAIYTRLGAAGGLNAGMLVIGTVAVDANDYLVYDAASGALYYDANAALTGGMVQLAFLAGGPTLSATDFVVI